MYRLIMTLMVTVLLSSCMNSPTIRGGSSNYATRDAEVVFGDEQTYPRIALVIGNNNYQKNKRLTNAVPDARAMRDFFTKRDFKVVYAEDADKETMKRKINEFMGGLGKKSVAVIYYAGHASQDKSRQTGITTNYLVPINDGSLTSITDYDRDAISMNYILNKADELNHGLNIAMLDACRTPIGRGGNIQNIGAEGVYLVYSTASGTRASDSGAFRRSFLKYAEQPLKLTDIFGKVKLDLRKEGQRPSIQNDVVGVFYFSEAKPISNKPQVVERVFEGNEVSTITRIEEDLVQNNSLQWIRPTKSICEERSFFSQRGKMDKDGNCKATWEKAKEICSDSGGRLPTIEVLRKVITDCGGEMNDDNNNRENSSYESCYKQKGFTYENYWSSTITVLDDSVAWSVHFGGGYDELINKEYESYIKCIF